MLVFEFAVGGKRRIGPHILQDGVHLVVGRQAKSQRLAVSRSLGPRHPLLLRGAAVAVNPQVADLERTLDQTRRRKTRTRRSTRSGAHAPGGNAPAVVAARRPGNGQPTDTEANRDIAVRTADRTARSRIVRRTARQQQSRGQYGRTDTEYRRHHRHRRAAQQPRNSTPHIRSGFLPKNSHNACILISFYHNACILISFYHFIFSRFSCQSSKRITRLFLPTCLSIFLL